MANGVSYEDSLEIPYRYLDKIIENMEEDKLEWWRGIRFLSTIFINYSGKIVKRTVKPEDIIKLKGDEEKPKMKKGELFRSLAKYAEVKNNKKK